MDSIKQYDSDIVQLLLSNTRVVTKQEVETNILKLVEQWKEERDQGRDLYVNGVSGQDHHWLYMLVRDHLPKHELICASTRPTDGSEILYIDDWLLSGCTASVHLEEVLYESELKDIKYTCIFNVVSVSQKHMYKLVDEQYKGTQLKIYSGSVIEAFDDILRREGISEDRIKKFNLEVSPDIECGSFAITSDYKIPNQLGSYPKIYEITHKMTK
uniref:Uncharacterized protein n=1 Tax=viral metagenome TaxID=1070528 RepID=A0A6C0BMC1_9ZZZZ